MFKKYLIFTCVMTLAPIFSAAPIQKKQETGQESAAAGYHTHDGFYLRMSLGLGAGNISLSDQGVSLKTEGGSSAEFQFQMGFSLLRNFQIFGLLGGTSIAGADTVFNGQKISYVKTDVSMRRQGGGFNFYMMPLNLYLGAEVTSGSNTVTLKSTQKNVPALSVDSERGLVYGFHLGKEWWVSDNWGLGFMLYYLKAAIPDSEGVEISNEYYGLGISATFN